MADDDFVRWKGLTLERAGRHSTLSENRVRICRENLMLSKAELARRAGLSALTIDRVEAGRPCRMDTKRRILRALGLEVGDHQSVFGLPVRSFSMAPPAAAEKARPSSFDSSRDEAALHETRRSQ